MSDPPKKLGSLRDRIAAFENKGSSASPPVPAPAPRPRPAGGVSWKPKAPSPPSSPRASEDGEKTSAGLSAADAKESIGRGVSLKDRMAALQGLGGFGGGAPAAPPPRPSGEKPKWKPPPKPIATADDDEPDISASVAAAAAAHISSPPVSAAEKQEPPESPDEAGSEEPELAPVDATENASQSQEQEPDPEEEERQRRAAIAARLARLGGTRVGMAPPIYGKKPEIKKSEAPKEEPKEEAAADDAALHKGTPSIKSPPADDTSSTKEEKSQDYFSTPQESTSDTLSPDSGASSVRSPSMPVPAVPRRAGPPRKKPAKSPSPAPPPAQSEQSEQSESSQPPLEPTHSAELTPPRVLNTEITVSPSPAPALDAEIESKEAEEAVKQSKVIEEIGTREPEMEPEVLPVTVAKIKEETQALEPKDDGDRDVSQEPEETSTRDEDIETPVKEVETRAEPVHEVKSESMVVKEEQEVTSKPKQSYESEEIEAPVTDEPAVVEEPEFEESRSFEVAKPAAEEPHPVEVGKATTEEPEEEEDETARRKRIAERLAKMGGVNPFAGPPPPPPVRKPTLPVSPTSPTGSTGPAPARKGSIDAVQPEPSPAFPPPIPVRRESTDSAVLGRRTSLRRGSTDSTSSQPLRSPPLLPTSPKPTLPTRKDSVGSIGSGSGIAPPRRASQDDHRDRDHSREPPVENIVLQQHVHRLSPSQELSEEPETTSTFTAEPEDESCDRSDDVEALSADEQPRSHPIPIEQTEYQYNAPRGENEIHESGFGTSPVSATQKRRSSTSTQRSATGDLAAPNVDNRVSYLEIEEEEIPPHRKPELFEEEEYSPPELNPIPTSLDPVELALKEQEDEILPPPLPTSLHPPSKRTSLPPPPRAPPLPPPVTRSTPETEEPEPIIEDAPRVQHASRPLPPAPAIDEEEDIVDPQILAATIASPPAPPPRPPNRPPVPPPATIQEPEDYEDDVEEKDSPPLSPIQTRDNVSDLDIQSDMDIPATPPRALERTPEPEEEQEEQAPPPPPPRRRQSQRHVPEPLQARKTEQEVLDDEDGDPIDPGFHSPLKSPTLTSASFPSAPLSPPTAPSPPPTIPTSARPLSSAKAPPLPPVLAAEEAEAEEDEEQARRRTIAERMAKLGGIRFGAPPAAPMRRPQPPPPKEDELGTESEQQEQEEVKSEHGEEPPEEEDEFARKQRIAARIAGMGGMRFGMLPTPMSPPASAPAAPTRRNTGHEEEANVSQPSSANLPPSRRPTNDIEDEGVHVNAEESEAEEVTYAEAQEEAPPPIPNRPARRGSAHAPQRAPPVPATYARPPIPQGRPPIPPTSPRTPSPVTGRKSSVSTVASRSAPPPAREVPVLPASDYVMVDEPESVEEPPPPPPPRPTRAPPSRSAPVPPPPPPATSHVPSDEASSPWQLPTIPTSPFDFETEPDLSLSGQWSEDSTNYPSSAAAQPPPSTRPVSHQPPARQGPPTDVQLSADELVALWGRVGVHIAEAAATLFDKSKKSVVGDGSYVGFIDATLSQVPNASRSSTPNSFGYLIYSQVGPNLQRRASDIMPGDIIVLQDAKLKGHKGIQIYHQNVGAGEPLVAVVADFEVKKSKVKVFQANQHVGHQSVESTSYRLEDLKSGVVKVFRVLSS